MGRFVRIGGIDVRDGSLQDVQRALSARKAGEDGVEVVVRRASGELHTLRARRRPEGGIHLAAAAAAAGPSLLSTRDAAPTPALQTPRVTPRAVAADAGARDSPLYGKTAQMIEDLDRYARSPRNGAGGGVASSASVPTSAATAESAITPRGYVGTGLSGARVPVGISVTAGGRVGALSAAAAADESPLYGKTAQMIEEMDKMERLRSTRSFVL